MQRARLKPLLLLLGACLAARILFILLMPQVYSRDLHAWLHVMGVLDAGGNPYGETEVLNWPPFWMQILFAVHQLSRLTGVPDIRGIQATLIACELAIICIAWFIGCRFFAGKKIFRALLFGLAINPVCVFLSCQHCNYDVFVGLWVLLTAWMLMDYSAYGWPDAWLMACFFIGMGILTKTVPVVLTPLLLTGIRKLPLRTKIFGVMLLGAPFIIGMSVLFTLEPHGVMHNVIGYRSLGGWYGFTGIMWGLGAYSAIGFYKFISPILFLGVMLLAAWRCYRMQSLWPRQVIAAVVLLMLFIPTFGPGYSPPYILWFLPTAVLVYIASDRTLQRLMLAGWIITMLTYITEYAILGSHGAFLAGMFPTKEMLYIADNFGGREHQTLIRLPMFIFYIVLFFTLIKRLRYTDAHPQLATGNK